MIRARVGVGVNARVGGRRSQCYSRSYSCRLLRVSVRSGLGYVQGEARVIFTIMVVMVMAIVII